MVLRSGRTLGKVTPEMLHTDAAAHGIVIRPSTYGLGAFATRTIPGWTVLGAYGGELLTAAQVDARYVHTPAAYVMDVGGGWYRDAVDPAQSNWLRYINSPHGSRTAPNCRIECGGIYRTVRAIPAGTELLVSYGRHYKWHA